jgi:hypothetical protein
VAFVSDHRIQAVLRHLDVLPFPTGHAAVRHGLALHTVDAALLLFDALDFAPGKVAPVEAAFDALVLAILALVNLAVLRQGWQGSGEKKGGSKGSGTKHDVSPAGGKVRP